ncbi:hypothetical protein [Catalinimonas alkaloidigena]|uniref:hypothetical protein n=1 Tax=Catalinimonas alkaloidigena TaxID=1075417 RepID=UPI002406D764|nr:hypothetical protein [Catalinimonas alkaloidigena]
MAMQSSEGIQIYQKNPFYWMYDGKPVLLIGGSMEDNLFQIEDLKAHLELLQSVGGNYVRCTMSARDEHNAKPFTRDAEGLFELDSPNPDYWKRLDDLLRYASKLKIVVQIEVWATYDFYWGEKAWADNPFNPKLNSTYTMEASGLPDTIDHPAQSSPNPFFLSVPALNDNQLLLNYQKRFVNKLMEVSLPYDNVLYCIDNETTVNFEWGKYWSAYLHQLAQQHGKNIYVTEMWDSWDPTESNVEGAIVQAPELNDWYREYFDPALHETAKFTFSLHDTTSYQFLDVSNHNAQKGEVHYLTGLWAREAVARSEKIRPINNVKIYGGDRDKLWSGNHQDGRERFWRNVFAGHAAVRFHRQPSGIALTEEAQHQIKSLRMLTDQQEVFTLEPSTDLLSARENNEAYCLANEDKSTLIVYFPAKGSVHVNAREGTYELTGMDISVSKWRETETLELPGTVDNPLSESYAVVLKKK